MSRRISSNPDWSISRKDSLLSGARNSASWSQVELDELYQMHCLKSAGVGVRGGRLWARVWVSDSALGDSSFLEILQSGFQDILRRVL